MPRWATASARPERLRQGKGTEAARNGRGEVWFRDGWRANIGQMEVSSGIEVLEGHRSRTKRASDLAARQFGAIARRQLLQLDFSPERIQSWVKRGRLHRTFPGVYAVGRPGLATEGELSSALLYANHGAALASVSALWWLELLGTRPNRIHIDAPGDARSLSGVCIRHPRAMHRTFHRGLPVVPLPAALLAATSHLRHNTLRLVLARAEFHHLLSLSEVHASLGRGRPGSTAIRAAMAAHLPQLAACESPLEIDFVLLCELFGLPLPEPNRRIGRWRPDMQWHEARLIVELDGKDAHRTAAQLLADERRAADLRDRGFTVIRFSWEQVHFAAAAIAADLRVQLG